MKDSTLYLIMGIVVFLCILPLHIINNITITNRDIWTLEILCVVMGCFCILASIKLRKMGD